MPKTRVRFTRPTVPFEAAAPITIEPGLLLEAEPFRYCTSIINGSDAVLIFQFGDGPEQRLMPFERHTCEDTGELSVWCESGEGLARLTVLYDAAELPEEYLQQTYGDDCDADP